MGEDRSKDRMEGDGAVPEGRLAPTRAVESLKGQRAAIGKLRETQAARRQRRSEAAGSRNSVWMRVTYTLPRAQAKEKAREFLSRFPKAAYWSEVESWRVLEDDVIEFTMRRLPSAD